MLHARTSRVNLQRSSCSEVLAPTQALQVPLLAGRVEVLLLVLLVLTDREPFLPSSGQGPRSFPARVLCRSCISSCTLALATGLVRSPELGTNKHSLTHSGLASLPLSLSASSRRASSRGTTTTHSTGGHRDDVEEDARATTTTTTPSQTGRDDEATATYLRTNFTALIRPRIAARLGPLRDAQALGPPS